MRISLARHFGMCFGVREALRVTHQLADNKQLTILGQLVHNPVVDRQLALAGVRSGSLDDTTSGTRDVVITAHGASDKDRRLWADRGFEVHNTTCPLVHRAHQALRQLVAEGFMPVVIGKPGHVEVRGLIGDFPQAAVIQDENDVASLPFAGRIGVVSQTTQQVGRVGHLVALIQTRHPEAEVRYVDTVCQPTKDRQTALINLCRENQVIVVVGGPNSNNTSQLARRAEELGCTAYHISGPEELQAVWFRKIERVGITAGTSTLDETVYAVRDRLVEIAAARQSKVARVLKALAAAKGEQALLPRPPRLSNSRKT